MTRVTRAARLYFINRWPLIYVPFIVIGASFAITIILKGIVNIVAGSDENYFNGAFQSVFWCLLAVAVAASTQMFPYAFALSLTRREFWMGSVLAMGATGVAYGLLYGLIAIVERATHGYGLGARYFLVLGGGNVQIWQLTVFFIGAFLLFFMLGFAGSMLWKRLGGKGLVIVGLALFVLLAVLLTVIGLQNWWMAIGTWFGTQPMAAFGGYMTGCAALLAGATFLLIRHAEP